MKTEIEKNKYKPSIRAKCRLWNITYSSEDSSLKLCISLIITDFLKSRKTFTKIKLSIKKIDIY